MNGHRLLGIVCLFVTFSLHAGKLNADPLNYRIDFTREGGTPGSPTPLPVTFTYDAAAAHFSGGEVLWGPVNVSSGSRFLGFPSLFDCLGPFPACPGPHYFGDSVNNWSPEQQRVLLNNLLTNTFQWNFSDAMGDDVYFRMGDSGLGGTVLGLGYSTNTQAFGTFTTTLVSEPPALLLCVAGLFGLLAVKPLRLKILASSRNGD
jgi:hypothetical protein